MIRAFKEEDIDEVIAIWLAASLQAHDFIDRAYWESKVGEMRTLYLPLSEIIVSVDEQTHRIEGFIGIIDDFLAALFVDPDHQGRGVGTRLLRLVRKIHPSMELTVYARNNHACSFYEQHGFRIVAERVEAATGEKELVMRCGA